MSECAGCLLLQVSDTHFGCEDPAAVKAVLALAHRIDPEIAVFTGDLTQRATPAEFAAAGEFVRALQARHKIVLPGNHDVPLFALWRRLLQPYGRYRRVFGAAHETVFDAPRLRLVVVDSVRNWRHRRGALGLRQCERAAAALRSAGPNQLRVVAMHHPLVVRAASDTSQRLPGAPEAARLWARAGADLVLGGHIHHPFVAPLHDEANAEQRPLWAVQAGTAVSLRLRHGAPNSVNAIHYDAARRRACVRRWDLDAAGAEFAVSGETALVLGAHSGAPLSAVSDIHTGRLPTAPGAGGS